MNHFEIDRFRSLTPMQLPGLINPERLESIEDYGDYALLTYSLETPVPVGGMLNRMEDGMNLSVLYHVVKEEGRSPGHQCCAYSSPQSGQMYKFNAQTGPDGMVKTIYVHVFESLEVMLEYLKDDLERHKLTGRTITEMRYSTLIADFM